ncbi:c-type cytochrome [Ponticoccus sp. SC2-23]|uniref:c-type cytochrome n=1 Tax=Alexandriicola marinus TaxID=2081710 RepID=UPI000FD896BA|nr:c-type cytochrome [Alexandriicola marinus]MBM1220222.1 c-type cytochrome [Ponticoccus sp. SC6-9]MBM1224908.1 c-type cytochrome [Ponticoccus sp. SC6-15]MBM1228422.1 c-type cytochrome [Ponticoccus sp. SC6-38]MBM1233941.1 c-type cytochrome [Ponticoccus sp. SC6-45]MBM1238923.1 c-type cytochrome [Ponticoccus sp. SC6-49]MBM1242705.1 c-type cytochrome [Ponticoccus sp. SC2-64]MBM1247465.1 c-type cytochrome [Ponticoccus sp. SC6-42]MBM1251876.1 c-type cytochrome [Ponticoccus sp. SC6-33]MBM1256932
MSKFLNIFAPAIGGVGLVLGAAYAIPMKNYRAQEAALAMEQAAAAEARAAAAEERIAQEAARAAEEIAALQAVAATAGPSDSGAPAPLGVSYALGREALPEEVSAWDIDIRPDGQGLPVGSGDVWTGEEIWIEKCAACHGDFGEAVGRWPVIAGGEGSLASDDPVKTVGSYWPYLSTVWDYVHRAMPFGEAQSLTDDEVYALVAYILYSNYVVDDDFTLSNENFTEVVMPNAGGFFMDDRAEAEYPAFTAEPCMENCKDSVEITARAMVLDVTPDDPTNVTPTAAEPMTEATAEPEAEMAEAEEAPAEEMVTTASVDPALVAEGEGVFRRCSSCHQIGEGAVNRTGPHLNGIMGRGIGVMEDFRYSNVMAEAGAEGRVWSEDEMAAFLADPRGYMRGTKMAFAGLRSEEEITALIAYLTAEGG